MATPTPFELVLALSRYRQLLAIACGARGHRAAFSGFSPTAHALAALAPQLSAEVHVVVAEWDALALCTCFANAEAMLSPYLLLCPDKCTLQALSRPGDADADLLELTVQT